MKSMIGKVSALIVLLLMSLFFVACNATEYKDSDRIIEAADLVDLLSDSNTVVIDARSEEDYNKGHLAGAVNLPSSLLTVSDPVNGTIAPKGTIEEVLGAHGISADSNVFIYDNAGGVHAARIWWVMKVYGHENVKVINGGETAIASLNGKGLTLTVDETSITPVTYTAKDADTSMIATLEDVLDVVENGKEVCILDVRSAAEYDEGAIPGAILYPHTKNLYADGTFKSARDIGLDYKDLGIEKDEPVILYCKSSFRATQTLLVLEEAGYTNLKVYDGAWLEYSTKDVPKEEKTEEKVTPSAGDGS